MAVTALATATGDDIAAPLSAYHTHRKEMELPAALKGGTKTMRLEKTKFLPQEAGESDKAYQARLDRSVLLNKYWDTVKKLASEVFDEEIAKSEDSPEQLTDLFDDIDLQGNSIETFLSGVFRTGLHEGVSHVMVEYPMVKGSTVEDHKKAGARPYWVEIKPESIIGWRFEAEDNGKPILAQLRIKEEIEVKDGKYGVSSKERVRLYERGYWAIYEEGKNGWEIAQDDDSGKPLEGKTSLSHIPLVTFMPGEKVSDMTAEPCLMGLAEINCTHWQSSSDQRNILHYARMIIYFGKQLSVDAESGQVIFGSNRLIHSTSADADLKVVEHSGEGIEAGRNDLKDLELAMSMYGLALLMPKTGNATATEKAIDKAENDSVLGGYVKMHDSAVEQMCKHTCEYMKVEHTGEVKTSVDFKALLGATDQTVLLEGFKIGLLPRQLVVDELKARGVITQEIDLPDLLIMLEADRRQATVLGSVSDFAGSAQSSGQSAGTQVQ
jgi:hypothetical protein